MTLTNGRNSTMKFVPDVSYNHDLSLSPPPPLSLSPSISLVFSLYQCLSVPLVFIFTKKSLKKSSLRPGPLLRNFRFHIESRMSGGILDNKLSPRASRAPVFVSTFIRQSDLDKIQVYTHRGSSGT